MESAGNIRWIEGYRIRVQLGSWRSDIGAWWVSWRIILVEDTSTKCEFVGYTNSTDRYPSQNEIWGIYIQPLSEADFQKRKCNEDRGTERSEDIVGGTQNWILFTIYKCTKDVSENLDLYKYSEVKTWHGRFNLIEKKIGVSGGLNQRIYRTKWKHLEDLLTRIS